jgi:hypothetical protein
MNEWHVVTGQGGVILGVYGSALLADAQEKARVVERVTGLPARVEQVTHTDWTKRPRVGQTLTEARS